MFREDITAESLAREADRKRERQMLLASFKSLSTFLRDALKMCRNSGDPSYAKSYLERACSLLVELEQCCLVSDLPREEWWGSFVSPAAAAVKRFSDQIPRMGSKDTGDVCWCGATKVQRKKNRICPVHRPGLQSDERFYRCGHPRWGKSSRCERCRAAVRPSRAKPIPGLESDAFKVAEYLAKEFDRKVALNTGVPVCKFCAEFKTERLYQFQQKGRYYTRRAFVCYCRRPDLVEQAKSAKLPNSLFEKLR